MTIVNQSQLENTRAKLKQVEDQYSSLKAVPPENTYSRELTLRSLQRWIKRLREEIMRYECQANSAAGAG